MSRLRLYLFVGYPGAGKTTIAKFIAKETRAIHLWADFERQVMFTKPTHSRSESQALYEALDNKTEQLLQQGKSVIFDTNFNYFIDRELLRNIAARYQAEVSLIWLTTPKEFAKQRALHNTHSDRNGYQSSMSAEQFDYLSNHLEPPTADEQPIKFNGSKLDYKQIKLQLGI